MSAVKIGVIGAACLCIFVALQSTADELLYAPRQADVRIETDQARARILRARGEVEACLVVRPRRDGEPAEVTITPKTEAWNLGVYDGVSFALENPGDAPVPVTFIVESREDEGKTMRARLSITLRAKSHQEVPLFFRNGNAGPYWGMRGIPVYGPLSMVAFPESTTNVTPEHITRISVRLDRADRDAQMCLQSIHAFTADSPRARLVPHPFVDAFGQYMHEDWPGKAHDEAQLKIMAAQEDATLREAPGLSGRDAYGGWADGPKLEATGRFRTAQVNSKWWLVTPDGHLFFSLGVNCVREGDNTFIDGRGDWFEWVPKAGEAFSAFLGRHGPVHSMAEAIGGGGVCFNFHAANLMRIYGDAWQEALRDRAARRLKAWGFNTIGMWSRGDVLEHSGIPFVVTAGSRSDRVVEGSTGYWGKMMDVFDPSFVGKTLASIASVAEKFRDNPLVIGYFVDNEMSWSGIPQGALASPPDQPARIAFIADLQQRYENIEKINAAWEVNAADWNELRAPTRPTPQSQEDLEAFEYKFARHYFDTVAAALQKHAPGQLYLGCRFTPVYAPRNVVRACAEVVDVISINAYAPDIAPDRMAEYGKPVIIGEFHFGALDRGMFHTGLVASEDQQDRARKYVRYVESVASNPVFVGCHWFQYMDQPLTGRTLDGENYAIGLVNVVDAPYAELTDAARDLHQRLYVERYGSTK